jgi:SAM-dependent methyltransferase
MPPRIDWRRRLLGVRNVARRVRMSAASREVSEDVWRRRGGDEWVEGYWGDDHSPRRDQIVDQLRLTFGAPSSVLDVGCNAGPNLRRIAAEFPSCRLVGFDINDEAIAGARERFSELGLAAELSVGSYYDVLPATPSDSVDVVITSFSLAYVPPAHLAEVLGELIRIARWGIILAEPLAFDHKRRAGVLTVPWYDWRHDYVGALHALGLERSKLRALDLPVPGGRDSGLVVVDLRPPLAARAPAGDE